MSISDIKQIDNVDIDQSTGKVFLSFYDHLDWDEDNSHAKDQQHAWELQEKLNTYLAFIETGQMGKQFPETKGKDVVIVVAGKYPLDDEGKRFYEKARMVIRHAGFDLLFAVFEDDKEHEYFSEIQNQVRAYDNACNVPTKERDKS